MDEPYLIAAARYVELNPVRAGLVTVAEEWPWSSARPHLSGRDDRLVKTDPLLKRV
jgi:putative transposase